MEKRPHDLPYRQAVRALCWVLVPIARAGAATAWLRPGGRVRPVAVAPDMFSRRWPCARGGHGPVYLSGWAPEAESSMCRSWRVVAKARTVATSSCQGFPPREQACKRFTPEAFAASLSSAHACCNSASCAGVNDGSDAAGEVSGGESAAVSTVLAGFRWKKLRSPIHPAPLTRVPPGENFPKFRCNRRDAPTVPTSRIPQGRTEGPHSEECGPSALQTSCCLRLRACHIGKLAELCRRRHCQREGQAFRWNESGFRCASTR
ncbi:hypothetical protein SAMN06272721_1173 [Arthrobacter sp. P2b]|nr:hypothetical protein SAMN06272721_1173 [Arthrobacter sp. P2b]